MSTVSIVQNMPREQYDAADGINISKLLPFVTHSPAHGKYWIDNQREATPAMALGTLTHSYILTPDELLDNYVVAPDVDRRTKDGKERWAQFQLQAEGKMIVTAEQLAKARGMRQAVRRHSAASELTSRCAAEVSVFWTDDTGVKCKARIDLHNDAAACIADIKTTADARPAVFRQHAYKLHYHVRMAWYADAVKASQVIIIAVESEPPYAVQVYEYDESALDRGRAEYQSALMYYHECLHSGKYPSYPTTVEPLTLPAWAQQRDEVLADEVW